jgi:histidine triad (HIT) family protein
MIRSAFTRKASGGKPHCVFCSQREIQERTIARTALAWAFPTNAPIVPGHILICPRRCVESIDELSDEELLAVFSLRKQVQDALVLTTGAQGFNFAWNQSALAGQTVAHLHLHVVPRHEKDQATLGYDPRLFLYRPGSRPECPQEELIETARSISFAMEQAVSLTSRAMKALDA